MRNPVVAVLTAMTVAVLAALAWVPTVPVFVDPTSAWRTPPPPSVERVGGITWTRSRATNGDPTWVWQPLWRTLRSRDEMFSNNRRKVIWPVVLSEQALILLLGGGLLALVVRRERRRRNAD